MNNKILASVIAIIAVVVLGFLAFSMTREPKPTDSASMSSPQTEATTSETTQVASEVAATITYTDEGFSPSTLSVKKGSTIRVVNSSSDPLEFSSDNHPTHLDNSELNMDVLAAGKTGTFTVKKSGEFGFHDHLNASNEGTLTVTE